MAFSGILVEHNESLDTKGLSKDRGQSLPVQPSI